MILSTASNKRTTYLLTASMLVLLCIAVIIPSGNTRIFAAALLLPFAILAYLLLKKRSTPSIYKRQVLLILGVSAVIYVVLYYMTALHFGFVYALVKLTPKNLLMYVLPITAIIIMTEIIRSVVLAQQSRLSSVLCLISCVIAEVAISTNISATLTLNRLMDLLGLALFPAVTSHLLYHYLSKRYGMLPSLTFRLITTLFPYLLPYASKIPDSLYAFAKLIVPLLIYVFVDSLFEKKRRYAAEKKTRYYNVGVSVLSIVMISVVMLISCQFRFCMLVVATESMTGDLNVGDAVIYEQYDGDPLEVGQVIVFTKGRSTTVHRIVDVTHINGEIQYYTKGDANNSNDDGYVTAKDILGVVRFKIAYLGYPTVWLRKLFA